jgi:acyl-lipid omega-6 desaturase (Delta-12 desaturase)
MQNIHLFAAVFVYARDRCDWRSGGIRLITAKDGHYSAELRGLVVEMYNHCRAYMVADDRRAWWQIISTFALFLPLMALMYWLQPLENPWAFVLAIPNGALLVRIFALQHDCGHGSFFTSKRMNEVMGQIISVLTFTPYDHWRRSHAVHHAGSGNLERRGIGDIETMTIAEFEKLTPAGKRWYRLVRHPLVALIIGPPLHFLVLQRGAFGSSMNLRDSLPGIMWHNLALVLFYGALCWFLGTWSVIAVVLPTALVASWIGGWLFFVQHQFEETLWEKADKWDVKTAALLGSSHLQLPALLNWFTCDIGLHHIHHLSSRIPNYRLRDCMKASEGLSNIAPKLSLWKALTSVHLALWDETERRLISFGEFRRRQLA